MSPVVPVEKYLRPATVFVVAALLLLPIVAHADPGDRGNNRGDNRGDWHDNGRGNDHHDNRNWNRGPRPVIVRERPVIVAVPQPVYRERVVYREPPYYYHSAPIRVVEVPPHVLAHLRPAPRGYFYCMGDRDVYMVSDVDNIIVQVIALADLLG